MSFLNTIAIVLNIFEIKENNKIIRVFSKDYGKLDLIYNRKNNKIKYSNMDIFNELYLNINFHNDYIFLVEMELISSNYKIRDNYKKAVYGNIVSELLTNIFPTNYSDTKIYYLTSKFYKALGVKNNNAYLLLVSYILKLLAYSGYKLNFTACNICDNCFEDYYYSVEDAMIFCRNCNNNYTNNRISKKQIQLLNKLLFSKLEIAIGIEYVDQNYLLILLVKTVMSIFEIDKLDSIKFIDF